MKRHKVIVNKTTVPRIGLTSILCSMLYGGRLEPGVLMLMVILTTDYLDGFLARKLGGETDLGAYLDVFADFFLVISVFYMFVFLGLYPLWIEAVFMVVFIQFLLVSRGKIRHDPVGRYYGTFLFGVIFLSIILFNQPIFRILTACIVAMSVAVVVSRYLTVWRYLIHNNKWLRDAWQIIISGRG